MAIPDLPLQSPLNRGELFVEEQSIVILDFGSQYTQLIARRIRELKVFSVVLPCTATLEEIRNYRPAGIILSGGPFSVYDPDAPPADEKVLSLGLPVLGVCYGLHYITHKLGGKVTPGPKREYGHAEVSVSGQSRLFKGLPQCLNVWMSHGDEAQTLPSGFSVVAKTSNALAAIQDESRRIWAVQFHPEVHHTKLGTDLLRNFVYDICGARAEWTPQHFIDEAIVPWGSALPVYSSITAYCEKMSFRKSSRTCAISWA
jgi:GMP synthase (glutamine-hydrolysing)